MPRHPHHLRVRLQNGLNSRRLPLQLQRHWLGQNARIPALLQQLRQLKRLPRPTRECLRKQLQNLLQLRSPHRLQSHKTRHQSSQIPQQQERLLRRRSENLPEGQQDMATPIRLRGRIRMGITTLPTQHCPQFPQATSDMDLAGMGMQRQHLRLVILGRGTLYLLGALETAQAQPGHLLQLQQQPLPPVRLHLLVIQAKAGGITGQDEDGLRVMGGAERVMGGAESAGKVMLVTDELPTMRHVLVEIVGGEGAENPRKRRFLKPRNLQLA